MLDEELAQGLNSALCALLFIKKARLKLVRIKPLKEVH
jgi:hypothetical protein